MPTTIHRRVERLRAGTDPTLIARLPSGWAVMGEAQFLKGYCLLLPDPVVPTLNALGQEARLEFLADMGALGDALLAATGAVRVNYAILGNVDPALHAHVIPRYADEPEETRTAHPWAFDWDRAPRFDPVSQSSLVAAVRTRLLKPEDRVPRIHIELGSLHHVDLTASDLERSLTFYDRVLPLMGFRRLADCVEGPLWAGHSMELGLQPARAEASGVRHDRYAPGLHHLAFASPSRADVDRVHAQLVRLGVVILDPPALYERYTAGYYAVFFADPDGMKLEYVYTPQWPA
jgi:catechol 2,3-dioxygenase-like lactoylglutathione lyase family enzyme/diadenosine tetraphosphate (Ap4A) HIT family hydrolase